MRGERTLLLASFRDGSCSFCLDASYYFHHVVSLVIAIFRPMVGLCRIPLGKFGNQQVVGRGVPLPLSATRPPFYQSEFGAQRWPRLSPIARGSRVALADGSPLRRTPRARVHPKKRAAQPRQRRTSLKMASLLRKCRVPVARRHATFWILSAPRRHSRLLGAAAGGRLAWCTCRCAPARRCAVARPRACACVLSCVRAWSLSLSSSAKYIILLIIK